MLTEEAFFEWMRQFKKDNKLTQDMVNAANAMIASMGTEAVQKSLSKINGWTIDVNDGKPTIMAFSQHGFDVLGEFEKFVSKPYLDMVGKWTIGYGNTYYPNGKPVKSTDKPLTKAEAIQLKIDIVNRDFAAAVNIMLANEIEKGRISQNQFDALVCLAYNIGVNAMQGSSVIRNIKQNRFAAAADSFLLWNKGKVNGVRKVIKGLVNRREKERALFLTK